MSSSAIRRATINIPPRLKRVKFCALALCCEILF